MVFHQTRLGLNFSQPFAVFDQTLCIGCPSLQVVTVCHVPTCNSPTSGIPAYAAIDVANEFSPGPSSMILCGPVLRKSWNAFCPNPKFPC